VKQGLDPIYKRLELMEQEAKDFIVEDKSTLLDRTKKPWR